MPTIEQTLLIAGAAEGSYYRVVKGARDDRYKPSFANANSGLSFGVFQFDVATNSDAQAGFKEILRDAVDAKLVDRSSADALYKLATKRNAGAGISQANRRTITTLLGSTRARLTIDRLDKNRAKAMGDSIAALIASCLEIWRRTAVSSDILTPGTASYLRLFAYFLACLNRYPGNEETFRNWLRGAHVSTLNAPAGGFHLTAPPTLQQMHDFLRSLRIWSGSQGNYQNLRDRLDPTLDAL